jgi:hypothetical protein
VTVTSDYQAPECIKAAERATPKRILFLWERAGRSVCFCASILAQTKLEWGAASGLTHEDSCRANQLLRSAFFSSGSGRAPSRTPTACPASACTAAYPPVFGSPQTSLLSRHVRPPRRRRWTGWRR